jgi:lysophospholipid hydrolase
MTKRPKVRLNIARTVIQRLSPFVRQIDFALGWVSVGCDKFLYRQDDKSDCTYLLLSGRLQSVVMDANDESKLVGEYGRGDLVGIVETLTEKPRSTTVIAVRDTKLAIIPAELLNFTQSSFPSASPHLMKLLGHRILGICISFVFNNFRLIFI